MNDLKRDVLILGEGGAGAKIVRELIKSEGSEEYNCAMIVASSNERREIRDVENDLVGLVQLGIDGTGKDPALGYQACQQKAEEIDDLIKDYGMIFHVMGFGGGTGVGSAFYIGQNYPADEGQKYHYYIGAMPEFRENAEILENCLQSITLLEKHGRVWPMDNRQRENKLLYTEINQKIANEIKYILNLPELQTVSKDMDTTNVLKVLFPEGIEHRGIFTFKRYTMPGFEENIPFDELDEYNKSISYNLDYDLFTAYGYILNFNDLEKLDAAQEYQLKFDKWLRKHMPGASTQHDTICINNKGQNEIILFASGPVLTEEQTKEYVEEVKRINLLEEKQLKELSQKEYTYEKKKNKALNFNKKEKPNPFAKNKNDEEKKLNPFNKKGKNSFMNLLGNE